MHINQLEPQQKNERIAEWKRSIKTMRILSWIHILFFLLIIALIIGLIVTSINQVSADLNNQVELDSSFLNTVTAIGAVVAISGFAFSILTIVLILKSNSYSKTTGQKNNLVLYAVLNFVFPPIFLFLYHFALRKEDKWIHEYEENPASELQSVNF